MTKLLPTFFACMILAIISERYSIREGGKLEYQHKDKIFYFMIVVLMIFLAGLRVRLNAGLSPIFHEILERIFPDVSKFS